MSDATELAAALNECMPLTIDGETYTFVSVLGTAPTAVMLQTSRDHDATDEEQPWYLSACESRIIGILWAECARRGWCVSLTSRFVTVSTRTPAGYISTHFQKPGTSALSFASAFAAARKAEEQR